MRYHTQVHLPSVDGPGGALLVISGSVVPPDPKFPSGTTPSTSVYTFATGKWTEGPPLLLGRRDAACAVFTPKGIPSTGHPSATGEASETESVGVGGGGDAIVVAVFGGSYGYNNNLTEVGSIELLRLPLDPHGKGATLVGAAWVTAKATLSPERSGAAAASTPDGTKVVIVGGFHDSGLYLDQTVVFDGTSLKVSAPFPHQRADLNLVTLKRRGVMLGFGGGALYPAYNETAVYDPLRDTWTEAPPLVDGGGRNRGAAAVIETTGQHRVASRTPRVSAIRPLDISSDAVADEWVVVAGGFSLNPFFDPMASTECFSAAAGKWVQNASAAAPCVTTPLPSPRGSGAATAINASCMVFIGGEPSAVATDVLQLCVLP